MPRLKITVESIPSEFGGCENLQLKLQTKKTFLDPIQKEENKLVFETEFEVKDDKPKGEAVWDHGDKRKFIYLTWFGTQNGFTKSFRRIKLYFSQMEPWQEGVSIRISGVLKDGTPACSTAKVIE